MGDHRARGETEASPELRALRQSTSRKPYSLPPVWKDWLAAIHGKLREGIACSIFTSEFLPMFFAEPTLGHSPRDSRFSFVFYRVDAVRDFRARLI
jgi:hypothetical protein